MRPLLRFAVRLLVLVLEQSPHFLLHCLLLSRVVQIFAFLNHLGQIQLSSQFVAHCYRALPGGDEVLVVHVLDEGSHSDASVDLFLAHGGSDFTGIA